jgi:glyoxylase-like metal-dependent hydrolase (beta-lactamase superfamily II)
MARITAFRVGHCTHPSCMVLKGSGIQARCFPSRAYLLETRGGNYLWDTGYADHFRTAAKGIYKLYAWATPVTFDERDSLKGQLQDFGIGRDSIDALLLSHFHADHIAGLRDFPGVRVICSAPGWGDVRHLRGFSAIRKGFIPDLLPPDIHSRLAFVESYPEKMLPSELLPFTHGWDVTETGELWVVRLPGHAVGHLGAFVATDAGWVLLAADAAWVADNYQKLNGPSELSFLIQHDRSAYYDTLRKLHVLHNGGRVRIRISHDTADDYWRGIEP